MKTLALLLASLSPLAVAEEKNRSEASPPNIVFIFSDDHALNAISSYGGPLSKIAPTPHIDQLAKEGALFQNSFCANSICGPSRASILTGKHSHKNGFLRNTKRPFDGNQWTFIKELQKANYQTAIIGKWHLKSKPTGFDHWEILPGQGNYYNPDFIQMNGKRKRFKGYVTDITTNKAIDWLNSRDKTKPFILMCQHKAPHRTFSPALRHLDAFNGIKIPEPATLFDDYSTRSKTLKENEMEIDRHLTWGYDLKLRKGERQGVVLPEFRDYGTPEYNRMNPQQKAAWDAHFKPLNKKFITAYKSGTMSHQDVVRWKYQRYLKNYLGTVKAVDDSVGKLTKYLKDNGLSENTIVIYSSDQGFYLGEHGWFDKRWMFEESFKMPFVIKWPGQIKPNSRPEAMIQNIDYAPTFLEMAGLSAPPEVQGKSIVNILKGKEQSVRKALYYAYYEHGEHSVPQHFGVRTKTHKLIHFPFTKEWNLFDLQADPQEINNIYGQKEHAAIQEHLHAEYQRLRSEFDAPPYEKFKTKRKK